MQHLKTLQKCTIGLGAVGCGTISLLFGLCYDAQKTKRKKIKREMVLWSLLVAAKTMHRKSSVCCGQRGGGGGLQWGVWRKRVHATVPRN